MSSMEMENGSSDYCVTTGHFRGTGADSTRAERERKLKKPAGRAKGKPPVPVVPKSLSAVDSKTRTESAKPIETELPVHTTGSKRVAPTDGKAADENDKPRHTNPNSPDYSTEGTVTDKYSFFKPRIQVELEHADNDRTVTEIHIRGWKVDKAMMEVFLECWPTLPLLHTVHLWNTGLAADTLPLLASFLPLCKHLHTLVLDGNTLTGTPVSILFGEGSLLKHLSLRFCGITDTEAYAIGSALAVTTCRVSLLLTLNLSNNQIGDVGAGHIADGLKLNRSLLTLNLASNQIGDEGVAKLCIALSQFPLSHKQVVERRQLLSKKSENMAQRSRRPSVTTAPKTLVIRTQSFKEVKEKKEPGKRVRKESKAKVRMKMPQGQKYSSKSDNQQNRDGDFSQHASKRNLFELYIRSHRIKQSQTASRILLEEEEYEISPLTDACEFHDGELWLEGNRTLISLNLSRNRIGARGFRSLLEAIEYQKQPFHKTRQESSGLKRLVLHRNAAPDDDQSLRKLNKHMQLRDPFFRTPNMDLSKPNITPCSIPVIF